MRLSRWKAVTESDFPWEREALDFLREHLPDHEPWYAWSNFEFIDDQGRVNEVDLLLLCPRGLILVEIKSRPGTVEGDAHNWTWTNEGYLSASEVASLKLDADWVILSACNTAAGGATSAEALSGLARGSWVAAARSGPSSPLPLRYAGSLDEWKRYQATSTEDTDDSPDDVGPGCIVAVLGFVIVPHGHCWRL
jgi:Nuclease-related domain/CHAT domain